MMRKIGFWLLASVLLTFCSACGDDSPSGDPTDYGISFPKSYVVDYHVKAKDFAHASEVATLRVLYYDESGTIQQLDGVGEEWTKQVRFTVGDNTKIGLRAEWVLKSKEEIAAAAQDSYNLGLDISSLYDCEKNNGTIVTSSFYSKQNVGTTGGDTPKSKLLEMTANPYSSFLYIFKKLDSGGFYGEESSFPAS